MFYTKPKVPYYYCENSMAKNAAQNSSHGMLVPFRNQVTTLFYNWQLIKLKIIKLWQNRLKVIASHSQTSEGLVVLNSKLRKIISRKGAVKLWEVKFKDWLSLYI